jgi:Flp pilus assembly protein protease CpaA
MQLGELRLMWLIAGISIFTGIGVAFLTWFYPANFSKAFTSLACGFGMYQLVWMGLGRVPYDSVTPYGLISTTWDWIVNGGAIFAGIGTFVALALLLWRKINRLTKILGVSGRI